ncbi:hypothetical protein NS365_10880 [Aureimonas ureilytica]|uniref:ABC transporter substrate-binding protein n=1 Tax=Aureimonas ureilytica TaxID=401562 RepID=A0A175RP03_9HYPH|nr:hypothetical protein [Aureimonas ureilytica]KTR05515.1 hypothetical protein NS365_10880 [Aureimonas ureilytica]
MAVWALGASMAFASTALADEIPRACQDVGFGCAVMALVIERFEASNQGIEVKVENSPIGHW